jgi:PAS domain-containing protein
VAAKEGTAVQEEVRQIDTAPIDALLAIQAEQDQLKGLVARADETKAKVPEAVYRRVRKDYDGRLDALDARARPLRDKAREEQGRLRPLHERLRQALEDARLDVEELKFRREVGELKEEEFASRRSALDEALAQKDRDFQEADALAQRFVSVVGVLAPAAAAVEPEAPTAPRMKAPAVAAPPPAPSPVAAAAPATAPAPAPAGGPGAQGDETLFAKPTPPPTAEIPLPRTAEIPIPKEAAVGGSTVVMTFATLVATEGNPPQEYRLGPRTSIGRVPDNEICVPTPSISRKHAVIALTPDGYVLTDLESGNGTFVNEQRIKMSKLKDGDRIRLGNRDFVFRGPGAP